MSKARKVISQVNLGRRGGTLDGRWVKRSKQVGLSCEFWRDRIDSSLFEHRHVVSCYRWFGQTLGLVRLLECRQPLMLLMSSMH